MARRLAAILAADVVGYSRLMGMDEAGTLERLKSLHRTLVAPGIKDHGGRVVKLMGDGLLAEFTSVVAAVECAHGIQLAMASREPDAGVEHRLLLRIGVNLGDIIIDGHDIYGDGVNVAARLEALAEPGGLVVSEAVHQQVQDRLDIVFRDFGEHELKNIRRSVRLWTWQPNDAAASVEGVLSPTLLAPPDKPSIAVLPFQNLSGDADQDFFADGMAEDIITELSRMPWFFVIARNSSFSYKGRAVDVKRVARELGVKYVLEGSVRSAGARLRITAQLIDASTGQHVWAERYDRQVTDIFDVQDEVNQSIVGTIAPEFLSFEAKRARRKDPAKLDAWECVMRGRAHLWKLSREEAAEAKVLFQRAVELAPRGEFGAGDLALIHFLEAYYRWSDTPERSLDYMVETAERAVAADDHDPWALTVLAWANIVAHRWDASLSVIDRAVVLSPNFASAIGIRGAILALQGEPEAGIDEIGRAIRLSPRDGMMVFWLMGLFWAYFSMARYEEAIATAQRAIGLAPQNPTFRRQLASALAWAGRLDEARTAVGAYLVLEPEHTTADAAKVPSSVAEHVARFVEGLRRGGLPDENPIG